MPEVRPPFFIVGTGRSGTTMLRNLLRLHPQVHIPRETHWIPILFNAFGLRRVPHDDLLRIVKLVYMAKGRTALERILHEHRLEADAFLASLRSALPADGLASIAQFMECFYALLANSRSATIVGDKTPDYGLCMGAIQTIWPQARFLHIYRDGRDVAMSMSRVLSFRLLAACGINHWWAIALDRAYESRLAEASAEQPLERFFDLWHSRITRIFDESSRLAAGSYLQVAYEHLLAEPQRALEEIAGFLRLPDDQSWIAQAASQIARDNLGKNRTRPEFHALTERYGEVLAPLGFAV